MATIEQILTRIEQRLSLAAGVDVQTHAEDRLLELMRQRYEMIVDEAFWMIPEVLISVPVVLGIPSIDLTGVIKNFYDIEVAYLGDRDLALPMLNSSINPAKVREYCITPSNVVSTIFTVYPLTTSDTVHIWYRDRITDAVWEDQTITTEVAADNLLLILGVCMDYLADDGSNDEALENFRITYTTRFKTLSNLHQSKPMSKRNQSISGTRDRWE